MEIRSSEVPAATFIGYRALRTFAAERVAYAKAVRAYDRTGNADAFAKALRELAYEPDEIAEHLANPGWHSPEEFRAAA